MENPNTKIECSSCHKLVEIQFNKQAVKCQYCNQIIVAFEQLLPAETKKSSTIENKVSDK